MRRTRIEIDLIGETEEAFGALLRELNADSPYDWTPSELAASIIRGVLVELSLPDVALDRLN